VFEAAVMARLAPQVTPTIRSGPNSRRASA
jgi:hypothetical protein